MGSAAREEQAQAVAHRAWSRGGGDTPLSGLNLGVLSPEKERRKGQAREGIGQGLTWFVCGNPNTRWVEVRRRGRNPGRGRTDFLSEI